jgi:hypothetical protein
VKARRFRASIRKQGPNELDPEGLFADVDPSDDRWEP